MKKNLMKVLAVTLMLVMVLCLSSCGATKATVQTANGAEQVTVGDICDFASRYENRPITVTAKVESVGGKHIYQDTKPWFYYYTVELAGGWEVWVNAEDPIINTINVGDTVTAKGYVKDPWVYVTICGIENGQWNSVGTSITIVG